jgi:glycosyltransferase involved in cell wall biosynthesis
MKLSILIPTIPEHSVKLEALLMSLNKQKTKDVEILTYETKSEKDGGLTTGQKRNELLKKSSGNYVVFVDADDVVSNNYVQTILDATTLGYDVICFRVMYKKGSFKKEVIYSMRYGRDAEKQTHYERLPNHLMPVKRNLALKAKYPNKTFGEDAEYAKRLKSLLKSEAVINEVLYYYIDD